MPRIKLEGLAQPFESLGKGIRNGVQTGVSGVKTVTGAATNSATAGFTGVFSLGKGFRDFILRGKW